MKIVIIGTGQVGSFLAKQFYNSGFSIIALYNRTFEKAQKLAAEINSIAVKSIKDLPSDADIYFLAVNDSNIEKLAKEKFFSDKFIVHTAGAVSIDALKYAQNYGVFYPLNTFATEINQKEKTPIILESNNSENLEKLFFLAKKISENIHVLNSEQRLYIHLAAVFINNFVNHIFYLVNQIIIYQSIDKKILFPIIKQTINNALKFNPYDIQTGPARRKDLKTIKQHKQLLNNYPNNFIKVYQSITDSIIQTYFSEY